MSGGWEGSDRRDRLPPDWPAIRQRILERDGHRCTWYVSGLRCKAVATDVDHRRPGDDHRDSNLQSLCGPHHAGKSAREGNAAKAARKAAEKRPREISPRDLPRR
jgi:5-methylcytosine-specific restriction enzyme A